jgi:hypothetical protein
MAAARALGDSHNFGRRVRVGARRVQKPRTIFWERLVLDATSGLRRALAGVAERDGLGADAFGFLPSLRFVPARTGVGGEVERVELEPLGRLGTDDRRALAVVVGRSLALWSFLGVADLHWENLVLGRDARGHLVLAPLDVELVLADLALPTETKLLPDADPEYALVCRHAAGVRRVLPYLGKPLAAHDLVPMLAAYRTLLDVLGRHAGALGRAVARTPGFRAAPIRVCLRGTDEYVQAGSVPPWPPLLDAEREQLDRGDIPYFFRRYGEPGIHYYSNRALTRWKTLPTRGDVPKLAPLLAVARGFGSKARVKLREEGLFTLLGAFDHAALQGRHATDGYAVKFGARTFSVTLPSGETLGAPRNLSAVVGSVYLPCRCGEVRAVFVPAVTRCRVAL